VAEYRCISADLVTGTRIAEISLRGLTYSARLNNVGTLSGTLQLPEPTTADNRTQAAVLNDAVDEARRSIIVERDGVIVWAGIVWLSPYDDSNQTRSIQAAELWSYFRHRVVDYSETFTAADQFAIAQSLINKAQASSGGDIGVTVGTETCGVTRDRTYNRYELKPVGEAVEQLAEVQNGFDFAIDPAWIAGDLVATFRLSYPRRGRNYLETGHVFELGRNMIKFEWPSDGTRAANKVWATGNGEGDAMLITSASDASQLAPASSGGAGYPLLETVFPNKDISVQATLDAAAQGRLVTTAVPVVLPTITVRADVDPILGSYITGDAARIIIPPNVSPRFPNGLDTYRRIVGWDVSVSDEGAEEVALILGDEPVA
jgi:hypothetical protein